MKQPIRNLAILSASILLFGCISNDETVYRDVSRVKVEFENETAGKLFYETLSKMPRPSTKESNSKVEIPIVFEHKRHVVQGDSFAFNDAVAKCDTNRDGKITELEAKIFSQRKL